MPSSRSRARNSSTSARTCSAGAPSNSCSRPCVRASASAASGSMRHRAAPVSLSVSMPLRSSAVFPAGTSSVSPCDLPQDKIKFYVHGAVLSADRSAGFLPYIFGLSKRPFRIFPPDCFPNCKAKIRPGRSFDSLILSQDRSSCKHSRAKKDFFAQSLRRTGSSRTHRSVVTTIFSASNGRKIRQPDTIVF